MRPPKGTTEPLLIAQIETLAAVREAVAIAKEEGINVLFVGPADLRHHLRDASVTGAVDFEGAFITY